MASAPNIPLEALKARIRALQARTTANGCTEAEAATAAAALVRLMERHGLSDADVSTSEEQVKITVRPDIRDDLVNAIARVARCDVYMLRGRGVGRACYVGRHPWAECAVWLHGVVFGAVARAGRDFAASEGQRRWRTRRNRDKAREAFLTGFVLRLTRRLRDLVAETDEYRADMRLATAAVDGIPGISTKLAKGIQDPSPLFSGALKAGVAAADGVQLAWGVGGPAATQAIKGPGA